VSRQSELKSRIKTVKVALKSDYLTKKQTKQWQKRLAGLQKELRKWENKDERT